MVSKRKLVSLLLVSFTCSALADVDLKPKKDTSKNGQKRLDIHASKWREAQNAINSLIDDSISNEVARAKVEVKTLLEKNIAKHLHEASKQVMHGRLSDGSGMEPDEELHELSDHGNYDIQGSNVCQDKFENCATLAASGVCDTSRAAMKKHCARTCELCDDQGEELPPTSQVHREGRSDDTWTIIGENGERFRTSIRDIEKGTRKASITSRQVEKLLDYVKNNAHNLKLELVKPGVLRLIRKTEKKRKASHKITLKKHKDETKNEKPKLDLPHDNYWTLKEDKPEEVLHTPESKMKAEGPMIHFDLSSIAKNKGKLMGKDVDIVEEDFSISNRPTVHHSAASEEYLKRICHPMCKKNCISSCAPGCCAGDHLHDYPLYHRKSSHCHPLCKKHCISSCPLTCCAETERVLKTFKQLHVHHISPRCHPMCKKSCISLCPKACCQQKAPKHKSHCHPLCKKNCLSSCPLSCCSETDRKKEKCHPLCHKTCLSSCPDECCVKQPIENALFMKNGESKAKPKAVVKFQQRTCAGLCPDSCAPACHSGCCSSKKMELSHSKPLIHSVPSGCTANCVYECIPGCPPACCMKSDVSVPEVSRYTHQEPDTVISTHAGAPIMFPFAQTIEAQYMEQPQSVVPFYSQEQAQAMYNENDQSGSKGSQAVSANAISQSQADSISLYSPKHCPATCLTHCSPECVRSDCCDLD